jgi:hypothetical protein
MLFRHSTEEQTRYIKVNNMSISFGVDTSPLAASALPSSNVGLGWYNNNRKRLKKFATQYMALDTAAVATLKSQGEADVSTSAVQASRAGFNELRVRLPVLNQYYTYTGMHGGTADASVLAKIKAIILDWATKNNPTGKPIDETNFENLLRVAKARWADFNTNERSLITTWVNKLKTAKEAWSFTPLSGEGQLQYGNHYTHHYKILLQVYDFLGLTSNYNALLTTIDSFAAVNFPFGNSTVTYPMTRTVVGASKSEQRFDINGNYLSRFVAGGLIIITGNTQGNNGTFTITSASYLSGSDKTRIFVSQTLANDGGGGTLQEVFHPNGHAMPRPATNAGESIDYIRRDALHYQNYDLEPWLEIALMAGGTRYQMVVDNAFNFLSTNVLNPAAKHYEFAASTDPFDAERWSVSNTAYLQPEAMYHPDKMARVVFAYQYYKQGLVPSFMVDERLFTCAVRSDILPSVWYYYFRWAFGGIYG